MDRPGPGPVVQKLYARTLDVELLIHQPHEYVLATVRPDADFELTVEVASGDTHRIVVSDGPHVLYAQSLEATGELNSLRVSGQELGARPDDRRNLSSADWADCGQRPCYIDALEAIRALKLAHPEVADELNVENEIFGRDIIDRQVGIDD